MEKFRAVEQSTRVGERWVREILIFFGSSGGGYLAGRAIVDYVFGSGGQLTLKIFDQCLNTPECVGNLPTYLAVAVLGLVEVGRLFFRHKVKVGEGERWHGGFKY